jgi:putative acetyltransferase
MDPKTLDRNSSAAVTDLFAAVFTASEGDVEGARLGRLAAELSAIIDNETVICFGAFEAETLVASIFFTRLRFSQPMLVHLLSPVAVRTEHQGTGIGQALIRHGLNVLKQRSAAVVITYGDPSFYAKVGFEPLSENRIKAPVMRSMPEGWLGQSLTDEPIPTIQERPTCVAVFNDPVYW